MTAAETHYDALLAAAGGDLRATTAWSAARLAEAGGRSRLGWLAVPPWRVIEDRLCASGFAALEDSRRVVFVGTGGWAFGARAAGAAHVVDSLDRTSLSALTGDVVSVSESGRTYETVILTSLARQSLTTRVIELSEAATPGGLSLNADSAVNAMFSSPLSLPFAWAAAAAGLDRYMSAHEAFRGLADATGRYAAAAAFEVPATGSQRIAVLLPDSLDDGTRLGILQVLRQGLCGKARPALWVEIAGPEAMGVGGIRIELTERLHLPKTRPREAAPALAWAMALLYGAAVFTAVVGVRRRIRFAEHPAVEEYKRRLGRSHRGADLFVSQAELAQTAEAWAGHAPQLAEVHLVHYDDSAQQLSATRLARSTGRRWEVHRGSRWNHHSYQAIYGRSDVGVVAIAPDAVAPANVSRLIAAQRAIAQATCASLPGRSLLLTVKEEP